MKKINQLDKLRKELAKFRGEIDKIDNELIKVIVKRFKITDKVRILKAGNNLPMEDKNRELEIMERIEKIAEKNKINPKLAKEILRLIIEDVKK